MERPKPSEFHYHFDPVANDVTRKIYAMQGMIEADPDGFMGASIALLIHAALCGERGKVKPA